MQFSNPYLLTLLIPSIIFVAYLFFKQNKKFRFQVNKVLSLTSILLSLILVVLLISGITFTTKHKVKNNQLVILVDNSKSMDANKKAVDLFLSQTIDANNKNTRIDVIPFAYNNRTIHVNNSDKKDFFNDYKNNNLNNNSTNLESALNRAVSIIKNKKSSKILILSDGIETDGSSQNAINSAITSGIKLNYKIFNQADNSNIDIKIKSVQFSNDNLKIGKITEINIYLDSDISDRVKIKLTINDEIIEKSLDVDKGENVISFNYVFKKYGVNLIKADIYSKYDNTAENNTYYSFLNIERINRLLILSRGNNYSKLEKALDKKEIKYEIIDIKNAPNSIDELTRYDQIILNNISNEDLKDGYIDLLSEYVYDYGGSILTVGGLKNKDGKKVPNLYSSEDLKDTKYQEMLPVTVEEYKPPVAVMIVLDASGSMNEKVDGTPVKYIDQAKKAAKEALKALDTRDYLGVIYFAQYYEIASNLTPMTKIEELEDSIESINVKHEGTVYSHALEAAGRELAAFKSVNKKIILFISDGEPGEDNKYEEITRNNFRKGIQTSTIALRQEVIKLRDLADAGGGNYHVALDENALLYALVSEFESNTIREYDDAEKFYLKAADSSVIFKDVDQNVLGGLNGFFGARLKNNAINLLQGKYSQPILAKWKYGNGLVTSFMSDLDGEFSDDLYQNKAGKKLINNIILLSFPSKKIKNDDIKLEIKKQNYINKLILQSNNKKESKLVVDLKDLSTNKIVNTYNVNDFTGNSDLNIEIFTPGIYEINVKRDGVDSQMGNKIITTFSYSNENIVKNNVLEELSKNNPNIKRIEDISTIYTNFNKYIYNSFDPRYLFSAIVLILFLFNLFVRKFKFNSIKHKKKEIKNEKNK